MDRKKKKKEAQALLSELKKKTSEVIHSLTIQGETMQKSINGLTSRTVAEENQISSAKDDSRKMHQENIQQ